MKKALALILTAAMLFSCLAVGASAARVYSVEEKVVKEDKIVWSDSSGVYGSTDPFFSGDHTLTITLKGDEAGAGKNFEVVAYIGGSPVIDAVNDKISFNGAPSEVSYDFADATWYEVQYVVEGDTTTVKVNGETVGTIDAYMQPMVYGTFYRCYIGEIIFTDADGNVRWGDDYEDGEDSIMSLPVSDYKETVEVIKNENVEIAKDHLVWSDSSGVYGSTDPFFSGDHTLTITLKGDEAGAGKNFEVVAYIGGSPVIDAVNDKISFNGAPSEVSYDFADATWYEVQYVVEGDTTTVKVNGETVGTIDAYMQPMVYGTFYRCYISEIIFTDADGNVRWGDDYEDGEDSIMSLPVSTVDVEGARHDLGLYYWGMDASAGHYLYPDVNASGVTVEFDFVFDSLTATDGTTNCTANWGNLFELDLQADKVGVNGQKLDYDFDADVWYHVEFIPDGASTAIYVDGAYVGTVAAVLGERLIGGLHGMGIDNLRIGDYFEDFEDQDFAKKSDGAGAAYNYIFDKEDPVDPFLTMGMDKVAEGDAYLLEDREGAYGIGYAQDYPSGVVVNGAVAYSFDLALLANDHRGDPYSAEKDPDGSQTWFEIWRDTASKRFRVGFDTENEQYSGFAGESDSLLGFDWGEMTADNFHNVVMVFKDRQGYIYVDGELFYQGPGGSAGISNSNTTLFGIVGGSAIIDNFEIYNVEDLKNVELMYEGAPFGGKITDNGSWEGMKGWTVGADCAENGHVFHNIDITVNETCYSLGEDTVYCAVCGEGYETYDRAMVPHNYTKYDINRTQDGLIYAHCQADGCVDKKFTTMTTEAYTGSVSIFMDMDDNLASAIYDGPSEEPNLFDNFKYENGVATTCEETYLQNYSRFDMEKFANNKPISGDWSVTFDLTYNSTWDTDDVINSGYEHYSLYMLGGNNNAFVTFNFEKDYVKISPNTYSNPAVTVIEKPFDFVEGETYNVQFSFHQHEVIIDEWEEDGEWIVWSEPAVDFYVRINGVNVIKYDYAALESGTLGISYENPNASFPGFYNQNFGVNYSMDNFVVATSDFTWNERTYVGDVNGDNYLDAADALAMRKLLAKVIDDSELATSRMDANKDGAINAKDQLTIRKALVA